MRRTRLQWRRVAAVVLTFGALTCSIASYAAPIVDERCSAAIVDAVLLQTGTGAVDRQVDVSSQPAVIGDLGAAPAPSCAFANAGLHPRGSTRRYG